MGFFANLFGGAKDKAEGAVDMAKDAGLAAADTAGNVASGAVDIAGDATDVVKDVAVNVAEGVSRVADTVVDEVKDMTDGDPATKLGQDDEPTA